MTQRLTIAARTENGEVLDRPDLAELSALLGRIGRSGDHFVVVERVPDEENVYVQAWRDGTGALQVEFRDGGPEEHFVTWIDTPDAVAALFQAWALQRPDWRDGPAWQPLGDAVPPPLPDERRLAAEEFVRLRVDAGFETRSEILDGLVDYFEPEPVTSAQASPIVDDAWERRIAEQQAWPETDSDRLATVFDELNEHGITARMHFTCCSRCGHAEIGAEAAEGARGYTFFHMQDTEQVAGGGDLWLNFGGFTQPTETVGSEVTQALTAAGFSVIWNNSPNTSIRITDLSWRKRLET